MSEKIRIKLYFDKDFLDEKGAQYVKDKALELLRETDDLEPETRLVSNLFVSEHIGKHILFECTKKSNKNKKEILEKIRKNSKHFKV